MQPLKGFLFLSIVVGGALLCPSSVKATLANLGEQKTPDQKAEQLISTGLYTDRIFLQGLDKVTGRVFKIEAKIGEEIQFEKLRITVRQCRKAPPEEPAESLAFLEIVEERSEGRFAPVFGGWMFASNPAVSGLEHPVYDVWVHECTGSTQNHPPIDIPSERSFNPLGERNSDILRSDKGENFETGRNQEVEREEDFYFGEGGIGDLDGPLSLPESLEEEKTVERNQLDAFYRALDRVPPSVDSMQSDNTSIESR